MPTLLDMEGRWPYVPGMRPSSFGKALLAPDVYVHWAKPMAHPVPAGER
jgi:hypothetical protein